MDSLQGEYAIKKEPDSDKDQNMNQATRDGSREMSDQTTLSGFEMDMLHLQGECVVKKEPDSDGDENINEPMRDKSRGVQVCGNSGNSFGNSGEESILGLPSDISVPSENNIYEDLPSDSVPPAVLSSQLCSRDLMGSSVKNELGNINVNLSSLSVEPVISAVEGQDPLFHTEFHIKTIDETPFSVGSDLESENDELSENMPESVGVPSVSDMPMKVGCTERNNDSSAPRIQHPIELISNLKGKLTSKVSAIRQRHTHSSELDTNDIIKSDDDCDLGKIFWNNKSEIYELTTVSDTFNCKKAILNDLQNKEVTQGNNDVKRKRESIMSQFLNVLNDANSEDHLELINKKIRQTQATMRALNYVQQN